MKKDTQLQRIINKLNRDGFVTRNQALSQRPAITRLGAIICTLEKMGWEIEAGYTEDGKDYVYKTKTSPLKKIYYKIGDKIIEAYENR